MRRIYLDHAATTPVRPEVLTAMAPWLEREFGNPSSLHREGRSARAALDEAREVLSEVLGCLFAEVTFTSSGTEASNLAVLGPALASMSGARKRVLLGAGEHHCVLHTEPVLRRLGYTVEFLPIDATSGLDLEALAAALAEDVLLVSVMHANNETGRIQPIEEVVQLAHAVGALVHTDAVQTLGVLPCGLSDLGVDLVSVSGHKIGGPKGVGALAVLGGTPFEALIQGGGQERERRAGTENVAGIVGFGAAARRFIAQAGRVSEAMEAETAAKRMARDAFVQSLQTSPEAPIFTVPLDQPTLPGHAHLRFPGLPAESMLIVLDREGIAASSGAACSAGSLEPSHVLCAMGLTEVAKEGLRFTFGSQTTVEEALEAAHRVTSVATRVREARTAR